MANPESSVPLVRATIAGHIALLIWSLSASCAVILVSSLPVYEVLSGIFISGFVTSSIINTKNNNWHLVYKNPPSVIIAGVLGIVGNDVLYILSFKYAPAIQVDLIVYLWPILVLILSAIILRERARINHVFASFL
ncbi:DMT family transporter, partial [Rickettsiaceae bacterium]|nr:DMT family transporter [Rickettsiaceae bacterium]